jgi:hypothetical protein
MPGMAGGYERRSSDFRRKSNFFKQVFKFIKNIFRTLQIDAWHRGCFILKIEERKIDFIYRGVSKDPSNMAGGYERTFPPKIGLFRTGF